LNKKDHKFIIYAQSDTKTLNQSEFIPDKNARQRAYREAQEEDHEMY
jgi:hypothetical protein